MTGNMTDEYQESHRPTHSLNHHHVPGGLWVDLVVNAVASGNDQNDTGIIEREKTIISEPPMYEVCILNDDYTPFDFVVDALVRFFQMSGEKAVRTMLHAHQFGSALAGVYPKDIAASKCEQIAAHASASGFPLRCDMQPQD